MEKMIYSESNERMIHAGFTTTRKDMSTHWTWDEANEAYFNDDCDDYYKWLDEAERSARYGSLVWD